MGLEPAAGLIDHSLSRPRVVLLEPRLTEVRQAEEREDLTPHGLGLTKEPVAVDNMQPLPPEHLLESREEVDVLPARHVGVVLVAPARAGLAVFEYAANLVKKSVVGAGHADKQQIAMMVGRLLPGVVATADAADALAVAICHAHHAATRERWAAGVPA